MYKKLQYRNIGGLALLLWLVTIINVVKAQDSYDSYYKSAEGKLTSALKTELSRIISANYVSKSYDFLYTIYKTSDQTSSGNVWDMYSTCTWTFGNKTCGNYKNVCDCYNREHSIPQSWFDEKSPMKSDAFHVYPTDGKVNGQRSNHPFGECANGTSLGGKALGKLGACTFSGYTGTVFEPIDEYKGDFARTYFYFVTRYESKIPTFNGASFAKNTYPALTDWSVNLFLKWHRQDPVSEKERMRNNAVYAYQKNRNPFIDHPELAEYIWGNHKGEPWSLNTKLTRTENDPLNIQLSNIQNGILNIRTDDTKTIQYIIYNITGKKLMQGSFRQNTDINIHQLEAGIYLFEAKYETGRTVQKFMVK